MIFSYNWLKEYIQGKTISAKEAAELLCLSSFEMEGLEKKGNDWMLDIDVLPNRAHDCFCHLGIAREVAALTGGKFKLPEALPKESPYKKGIVKIKVENPKDCPRYTAKVILGVKVGDSPKWLKDRLILCGLQPINNIVDITNYVMLETGQPLHAFDLQKLGESILVRRAKQGEKIEALDDKEYALNEDVLVIANEKGPVAIAGIKGGKGTGIDKKTKDIVVEAANFFYNVIRKASRNLKLKTDAQNRFEHEIDPNLIDFAQKRASFLIQKIAGGQVLKGLADFYPRKVLQKQVSVDLEHLSSLLGVKIQKPKAIQILKSLGFTVKEKAKGFLQVQVPTRRIDVKIQEDLIEEVGRIYGYKNISSSFPNVSLKPLQKNQSFIFENKAKDILKEYGLCEAYNYSFVSEKAKEILSLNDTVELENPMSCLNKYLRPSLSALLLNNARDNLRFFDTVKIFELGKVFQNLLEKKELGVVFARKNSREDIFFELKGVIEGTLGDLGIKNVSFTESPFPGVLFQKEAVAEIASSKKKFGCIGIVNNEICSEFGIKEKVALALLDFEKIQEIASDKKEYSNIQQHPSVFRDLALIVPKGTRSGDIIGKIYSTGSDILKDVDLFDVYSGSNIEQGKENLAFHIVYQSSERTLSSKEVDEAHQGLIKMLEEGGEWMVRK